MAINITTDINVTTGGKLTDIGQIQGGYQSLDTTTEMNALTGSSIKKGLLQHGQVFYINDTSELYIVSQSGIGIAANYTFNSFSWPGSATTGSLLLTASATNNTITFTKGDQTTFDITIDTGSINEVSKTEFYEFSSSIKIFTSSIQTLVNGILADTGSYATTGSNLFVGNQTIDGLLIITTQSTTPTYISGGVYLDSEYNLYLGST